MAKSCWSQISDTLFLKTMHLSLGQDSSLHVWIPWQTARWLSRNTKNVTSMFLELERPKKRLKTNFTIWYHRRLFQRLPKKTHNKWKIREECDLWTGCWSLLFRRTCSESIKIRFCLGAHWRCQYQVWSQYWCQQGSGFISICFICLRQSFVNMIWYHPMIGTGVLFNGCSGRRVTTLVSLLLPFTAFRRRSID